MPALRPSSLRNTILLLVISTVVGLTLLMLASVLLVTRSAGHQASAREFRTTAAFVTEFLTEKADATAQACRVMTSQPTFLVYLLQDKTSFAIKDWNTVSDTADEVRRTLGANSVVITDRSGIIVGQSPSVNPNRKDISLEAGIATALNGKTWRGVTSDSQNLLVRVAIPIMAPGGEFVAGTFYVSTLFDNRLAHQLRGALGCEVAFLSNGKVVASSVPLKKVRLSYQGKYHFPIVLPEPITSGKQKFIATYQQIEYSENGQQLEVLLLHSFDQANALLHALELGLIAPAILILLLAILAGVTLARSVTQPLDNVVAAAQLLREGQWPNTLVVERRDEIGLLQAVFNEMSESLRTAQERLLTLIDTDPLTGLDNHRRFQERLGQEVRRTSESGESLVLLIVDIDHFQIFNQRNGHANGDSVLLKLSLLLREIQPPFALSARYGGDELALLLPRTSATEARELAEQIRTAVLQDDSGPTVSIGFACHDEGTSEAESLALAAELALAQAKQLGRDRVCSFDVVAGVIGAGNSIVTAPSHLHRFLRDGSLATIQALAAAVDAKDPYTQGHSRRVADIAMLLAERIGLPPDEVDLVYTSGTLHDVGKIGVPDRILQNSDKLDSAERQIMETHPVMGTIIVGKVPQLAPTLAGVRNHHERWDGKGYPDGLAGFDIPLIARILAIADTFDAMTSDRPYRTGLPVEITLQEITRNAGKQFDPELAHEFVAMLRERIDKKC